MAARFHLSCRVRRAGGVRVLVPLLPGETLFVEEGEALPDDTLLLDAELEPTEGGETANALSLREVGHTLWPAGFDTLDQRLDQTRSTDNRLDMEERLQSWADLLCGLLDWWHHIDAEERRHRLSVLGAHAPKVTALLELEPPRGAQECGPHRGEPPWSNFPRLFWAPSPASPTGRGGSARCRSSMMPAG